VRLDTYGSADVALPAAANVARLRPAAALQRLWLAGAGYRRGGLAAKVTLRAGERAKPACSRVLSLFPHVRYAAAMPRRRALSTAAADAAMAAAQEMRRAAVKVRTEAPIGAPAYEAAGAVLESLDAMAEALTGRRNALHAPLHRAGG
jgi:hypothetical protein